MTNDSSVDFNLLTFDQKIESVNSRLGESTGRITNPYDLLNFKSKPVYIVLSPFLNNDTINLGTGLMREWVVGEIMDHSANLVEVGKPLSFDDNEKYICSNFDDNSLYISLLDFNIIPNNFNNHAIFETKDYASSYIVYRKMSFPSNQDIENIYKTDPTYYFNESHRQKLVKAERLSQTDKGA